MTPSLPAGVQALQHDQQRLAGVGVEQILQLTDARDVLGGLRGRSRVDFVLTAIGRVDLAQAQLGAGFDDEFLAVVHARFPIRS